MLLTISFTNFLLKFFFDTSDIWGEEGGIEPITLDINKQSQPLKPQTLCN